jgi:hypothetical protein
MIGDARAASAGSDVAKSKGARLRFPAAAPPMSRVI